MITTITTDFGLSDGFVGIMKGVILELAPNANFVELSNDVRAGDIESGAWILANSYRFFPKGTIHLAVVDPGVGSQRRGIIVRNSDYTFVGPDNGLFSLVLDHIGKVDCFWLNESRFWLKDVSRTFHGRDIFAPVVAHLLSGRRPEELGSPLPYSEVVRLPARPLEVHKSTVQAVIVYIDRFGNLISNAPNSVLESATYCTVRGARIPLCQMYSAVPHGQPIACLGSHGYLEIAINQGNAAHVLNASIGTPIEIELK